MDINKLSDNELDGLQKQLDERTRARNLAKHPLRGYRVGRPAAPEPGARPVWSSRFDISAVSSRVRDALGELGICSQKDDDREFKRKVELLDRTIDSEIARGFVEHWDGLDEEDREILLDAAQEVRRTLDLVRSRLLTRASRVNSMLALIASLDLPQPPLSHRVGEALGDGLAHAKAIVASGAEKAGTIMAEGATALKSLLV